MKVVINKCYGGFGLSIEAQKKIAEIGCKHIKKISDKEYFRDSKKTEEEKAKSCEFTGTPRENGIIISDEHRSTYEYSSSRSCSVLVKVVEEMGEKANGKFAELKIVEIPDGIDFEIEEYDGREWVAEKHRTWM